MPKEQDIDRLTTALEQAYAGITVERGGASNSAVDDAHWLVNHPRAVTTVQVGTTTGDMPFTVQSEFAPPTVAKSVEDAMRLVAERLGLGLRTR